MKKTFWLSVLFTCPGLILVPSVHAVESKKATLSELHQKVEQLKKEQQEQSNLREKNRELEVKSTQADPTKKFTPYSYP